MLGFEPRLSLFATKRISDRISFFVARSEEAPLTRGAVSRLRFAPVGAEQTSTGRLAPVYRSGSEEEPLTCGIIMIAIWYKYGTIVTNIGSQKRMGLHEKNCYNVRWLG